MKRLSHFIKCLVGAQPGKLGRAITPGIDTEGLVVMPVKSRGHRLEAHLVHAVFSTPARYSGTLVPIQGYGLKDICKHNDLVNFQWEDDDSGSQWSIVQFNRFLAETDPHQKDKLKTKILGYNRDDVIATRRLEEWLKYNFT